MQLKGAVGSSAKGAVFLDGEMKTKQVGRPFNCCILCNSITHKQQKCSGMFGYNAIDEENFLMNFSTAEHFKE